MNIPFVYCTSDVRFCEREEAVQEEKRESEEKEGKRRT
jgi:hypothetical protein